MNIIRWLIMIQVAYNQWIGLREKLQENLIFKYI